MSTISNNAIELVSILAKKSPEQDNLVNDLLSIHKGEAAASPLNSIVTTSQKIQNLFQKIISPLHTQAQSGSNAEPENGGNAEPESGSNAENGGNAEAGSGSNAEPENGGNNEAEETEAVNAAEILKQVVELTTNWEKNPPRDVDESIVNVETALSCLLTLTYLNENECAVNKEVLVNTICEIVSKYMDNMSSTIFKKEENNAAASEGSNDDDDDNTFKFTFEFLKNKANEFLKECNNKIASQLGGMLNVSISLGGDDEDEGDDEEQNHEETPQNPDIFASIMKNAMTALRANAEMHPKDDFVKKCVDATHSLGSIAPNTPTASVTKTFLEARTGAKEKSEAAGELQTIANDEINCHNLELVEKAMEIIACMVIDENINLDINAAAEAIENITVNTPSVYKKSLSLLGSFILICNINGTNKNGIFNSLINIAKKCQGYITEDEKKVNAKEAITPNVIKMLIMNDAPDELRQKVTQSESTKWMNLALEHIKSDIKTMTNYDMNSTFAMVRMLILDNVEDTILFGSFIKTMSQIDKKNIEKHIHALIPLYIELSETIEANDAQIQKGYEAITKLVLDNKDDNNTNKLALVWLMKSRIHTTEYKYTYKHALKTVMDIYAATKDASIYDGVLEKSINFIGDSEEMYTDFFDCATDYLKTVKSKKNEKLPQVVAAWAFAGSGHKARYYVAFYRFLTQFLTGLGNGVAEINVVKELYPNIATDFSNYYAEAFCKRGTEESQYLCDKDALKNLFDTLAPFLLKDKENTPSHMIDLYKQVTYLVDLASVEVDPSKRAKFDKLYKAKE